METPCILIFFVYTVHFKYAISVVYIPLWFALQDLSDPPIDGADLMYDIVNLEIILVKARSARRHHYTISRLISDGQLGATLVAPPFGHPLNQQSDNPE